MELKCDRCIKYDQECGPPEYPPIIANFRQERQRLQDRQMPVQDEQRLEHSGRGEGLTLQVQEKPSPLSLSLGKNLPLLEITLIRAMDLEILLI